MVLECVLADIKRDSNGIPEMENFSFKFKNTYKNNKIIIIDAGKSNKQQ